MDVTRPLRVFLILGLVAIVLGCVPLFHETSRGPSGSLHVQLTIPGSMLRASELDPIDLRIIVVDEAVIGSDGAETYRDQIVRVITNTAENATLPAQPGEYEERLIMDAASSGNTTIDGLPVDRTFFVLVTASAAGSESGGGTEDGDGATPVFVAGFARHRITGGTNTVPIAPNDDIEALLQEIESRYSIPVDVEPPIGDPDDDDPADDPVVEPGNGPDPTMLNAIIVPDESNHRIAYVTDMAGADWTVRAWDWFQDANGDAVFGDPAEFLPWDVEVDDQGWIYIANASHVGFDSGEPNGQLEPNSVDSGVVGLFRIRSIDDPVIDVLHSDPVTALVFDRNNGYLYFTPVSPDELGAQMASISAQSNGTVEEGYVRIGRFIPSTETTSIIAIDSEATDGFAGEVPITGITVAANGDLIVADADYGYFDSEFGGGLHRVNFDAPEDNRIVGQFISNAQDQIPFDVILYGGVLYGTFPFGSFEVSPPEPPYFGLREIDSTSLIPGDQIGSGPGDPTEPGEFAFPMRFVAPWRADEFLAVTDGTDELNEDGPINGTNTRGVVSLSDLSLFSDWEFLGGAPGNGINQFQLFGSLDASY